MCSNLMVPTEVGSSNSLENYGIRNHSDDCSMRLGTAILGEWDCLVWLSSLHLEIQIGAEPIFSKFMEDEIEGSQC